jgi:hypothetical protein
VGLTHIPDDFELTLWIPLVDHDAPVESADNQQGMFLQKDDSDNGLVFILIVLAGLHLLEKITSFTAILSDEASCIANKELSTFVAELTSSDVGIIAGLVQFGKDLLQRPSDVVVDSHIVGSEKEDVVGHCTYPEVKNNMKFIYLFWFFLKRWSSKLSDLLLTD